MNTPAFELLLQPRLMQGSWEMSVGEVTQILNSFTLGYKCSLWVLHECSFGLGFGSECDALPVPGLRRDCDGMNEGRKEAGSLAGHLLQGPELVFPT